MNINEQVCSIEQAQKLKELGILQNGYFVYRHWRGNGRIILSKRGDKYNDYPKHKRQVSPSVLGCAFTVPELLDLLPDPYSLDKRFGDIGLTFGENPIYYQLAIGERNNFYHKTAALVLADALIDINS